jgi:hypothetical protein
MGVRRAHDYSAQTAHVSSDTAVGIDGGRAAYVTDSNGRAVANPRFIWRAEA